MADIAWPAGLPTGRVVGRVAWVRGEEGRGAPTLTALTGAPVVIEADADTITWTGGPVGFPREIAGAVDADGYLCDAVRYGDPGGRGIVLPASDSPAVSPRGFTWALTVAGHTFRFTLAPGQVLDIATVASSTIRRGQVPVVDVATALRAEAAADRAQEIVDRVLDQGELGAGIVVPITDDDDGHYKVGASSTITGLRRDGTLPAATLAQVKSLMPLGIEQVAGTVTLGAQGPRIREFYTTGAATIAGVPIPADTAAVFRRDSAGAWHYRTVTQWVKA